MSNDTRKAHKRPRSLLALLGTLVLLSGCMVAKPYTMLKYDKQTDTFSELRIYTDIARVEEHGKEKLAEVWRERNSYIPTVACVYLQFGQGKEGNEGTLDFGLRRMGNHAYRSIDSDFDSGPAADRQQPELDAVAIKPGKLFLTPEKTLCYYHEISVPGKVVDELIVGWNAELRKDLAASIKRERERRANGGQIASWDKLQKELTEFTAALLAYDNPNGPAPQPPVADPFACLDATSLDLLSAAIKAEMPMYSRRGGKLKCGLPLSVADCGHAKALIDALRQTLAKPVAHKKPDNTDSGTRILPGASIPALVSMLQATVAENKRLVLTLEIPDFIDLTPAYVRTGKAIAGKAADYKKIIEEVKSLGASIDEKLTIEDVVRQFSTAKEKAK